MAAGGGGSTASPPPSRARRQHSIGASDPRRLPTPFHERIDMPIITRARHRGLLEQTLSHLKRINTHAPLELTCEELRRAALCLGKITGKISVDDVLDVVFSSFCIGK